MNANEKKAEQLGLPLGTAAHTLRKMIMFDLVKRLGENICFRCGENIESSDDFSIDHKEAWLDNDIALFWDLGNIAFSHLSCNVGCKRNPQKIEYPEGKKWCWRCKIFKDFSFFTEGGKRGKECKSCYAGYRKELRSRVP